MVAKGKRPMSQLFGSLLNGTKGLILWLDEGSFAGSVRGKILCVSQHSSSTPSAFGTLGGSDDVIVVDGRVRGQE